MKKTRKLIPALAMLLISAVMLSTASFAWFSMNTSVTASGMQIEAKSDNKFLQIVNATTDFDPAAAQTEATAVNATKQVRPTALIKEFIRTDVSGEEKLTGLTAYDGATTLVWAEAFSNDPAVSDKRPGSYYTDVSTAAKASDATNLYTLINTFKVRMNPTAGATEGGALKVANLSITAADGDNAAAALLPAIRVAIVGTDAGVIYSSAGLVSVDKALINNVTTTPSNITVYIYIDGTDAAATTNNAALGDQFNVSFTLALE